MLGALLTVHLLDPERVPIWLGWRLAFAAGAILSVAIVLVRRYVPESPRWLLLHGRHIEAEAIVGALEREHAQRSGAPLPPVHGSLHINPEHRVGSATCCRSCSSATGRAACCAWS